MAVPRRFFSSRFITDQNIESPSCETAPNLPLRSIPKLSSLPIDLREAVFRLRKPSPRTVRALRCQVNLVSRDLQGIRFQTV